MLLRWSSLWHTEGGWGRMLTFMALRHQKMLLRWRCCYVDGFDTLKMLLRWTCCYVEHVVALKMLLWWKCWKCFQSGIMDVKSKQPHAHFSHGFLVDYDIFHQQRKLMGSSAQNGSGVHWCRRRVRFNEVPEKVPKVPEKVWEALVQSQVTFNRVSEKVLEKVGRLWCSPEKLPEEVWEARALCCKAQCPVLRHGAKIQSCRLIMVVSHKPTK